MDTLGAKLNKLQDMIPSRIQIIENANMKQNLRSKLRDGIHNIDIFLDSMTQPALTLTQGQEYDEHINKVTRLITNTKLILLDTEAHHKDDTRITEFDTFRASLTRIEYKVALANATLCRWKALKIQNLLDIRSRNNVNQKNHNNITGPSHEETTSRNLQGMCTPRFHSWALLCLGTNRCYPNTNDVFHSPSYAKKPKGLAQDIFGYCSRINLDCRICRILEN